MNKLRISLAALVILPLLVFGINYAPKSLAHVNCNNEQKVKDALYSGAPYYDSCEQYNRFGDYNLNELYKSLDTTIGPAGEGTYQNINYTPPAGVALDSTSIAKVEQYLDAYKQAESETEVPWQLLAATHYRENSLSLKNTGYYDKDGVPHNCLGLFGFYDEADCTRFPPGVTVDQNCLKEQLVFLGNLLQDSYVTRAPSPHNNRFTAQTTDLESIKDVMYGYIGRASEDKPHNLAIIKQNCPGDTSYDNMPNYEFSSYVMNKYDSCRIKMELDGLPDSGYQWVKDGNLGIITFMLLISKQFGTPIIAGGGATLTGDVAALASQGAQSLAGQILNKGNISLNPKARCNMVQASKYGQYRGTSFINDKGYNDRTCDDNGTTSVPASPGALAILLILSEKYSFNVSSIATGGHSKTSHHFSGRGVDIGTVNGVQVSSSTINNGIVQQFYRDLLNLLPAGAEIGQQQCGIVSQNEYTAKGVEAVGDPCNHIHFGNV